MPRSPSHYKNWGNLEIELDKEKRQRYHVFKSKRKKLGLEYPTFEEIKWNTHCPMFGLKLGYFSEGKTLSSPSIQWTSLEWEVVSWKAAKIMTSAGSVQNLGTVFRYLHIGRL
jgi:hypothetical protein